jgi:hypothetical protein
MGVWRNQVFGYLSKQVVAFESFWVVTKDLLKGKTWFLILSRF